MSQIMPLFFLKRDSKFLVQLRACISSPSYSFIEKYSHARIVSQLLHLVLYISGTICDALPYMAAISSRYLALFQMPLSIHSRSASVISSGKYFE